MPEDKFNAMSFRLEKCLEATCADHPQIDRQALHAELWDAADKGQTFENRAASFIETNATPGQPAPFEPYLASTSAEINERWIQMAAKLATMIDPVKLKRDFAQVGLIAANPENGHLQLVLSAPNRFTIDRIESRFSSELRIAAQSAFCGTTVKCLFKLGDKRENE